MKMLRFLSLTQSRTGLYRGYGATVMSFGPFSALYFVFYEQLRQMAEMRQTPLSFVTVLVCSATAGSLAAWLTNVIDMAKLRIQVERAGSGQGVFGYSNVFQGVLRIVADEGWRGVFRGAGARIAFQVWTLLLGAHVLYTTKCTTQAPTTALALAVFEHLKYWFARVI